MNESSGPKPLSDCSCSCCVETLHAVLNDHFGMGCMCSGHVESERCDCSFCVLSVAQSELRAQFEHIPVVFLLISCTEE